jgi:glutaconate CoA-transferase subunit B
MSKYTDTEMMISRAAQELTDDDTVLVGVGVPNLACNLAKQTHAPDLEMIYESGTVDSNPSQLPLSIGDPVLATDAQSVVPMIDGFQKYLQGGRIDVGFLGGAQVDRWGNINSTVIGDYEDPAVRLPGSGGACEIASNTHRTIIITPHTERRFPPDVDFITSPGYVGGRKNRQEMGLRGGPETVITDKAVMKFDETGEMYVETVHPSSSRDEVLQETGWDISFSDNVGETQTPTMDELNLIRNDLDPDGVYTE